MKYEETLNLIYSNEVIMGALFSMFREEIEKSKPEVIGQDDEALGQEYRAYTKAGDILNGVFSRLKSLESKGHSQNSVNYK